MKNIFWFFGNARDVYFCEDILKADLRSLSNETRKRFTPIKEAAESAILKIKTLTTLIQVSQKALNSGNNAQILKIQED